MIISTNPPHSFSSLEVGSTETVERCYDRDGSLTGICPIVENPKWEITKQICGKKNNKE